MKTTNKLWIGIGILMLLSPLGLILPEYFKSGDAWGEWGADAFKDLVGYIPQGLGKLSSLWSAPIPDYVFKGTEEKGLGGLIFAYISSAIIGILVIVCVSLLIGKLLQKKERS